MLSLIRRNKFFFVSVAILALGLRILFVLKFNRVDGDSLIYGDIAKNWITHGIFGVSTAAGPVPTYIRLPGYPTFIAAIWAIVGVEHYTAVLVAQIFVDLATCFVVADLARRIVNSRAAKLGFVLTAVCPFLLTYVAAPLTETLAIFFAAMTVDAAVAGLKSLHDQTRSRFVFPWAICGMAIAAGILLRPDGGILLAAMGLYLGYLLFAGQTAAITSVAGAPCATTEPQSRNVALHRQRVILAGLIVATLSIAPLFPWTLRNWHNFHRFQPLAPRYANAPDEPVNWGFERWTKTWMLDFVSVSEIYWNLPDQPIDIGVLPTRAFDSASERVRTEKIFSDYNDQGRWTRQMDDALAQIARERIQRAPWRYYVWLPAGRIADMWFRPRTELLGINDRWWEFRDDPSGAFWAALLGLTNLLYIGFALYGLLRVRQIRYIGMLVLFVVLRSLFLGTLENPEPRYTLECYPVVVALAAAALARKGSQDVNDTLTSAANISPTFAQELPSK